MRFIFTVKVFFICILFAFSTKAQSIDPIMVAVTVDTIIPTNPGRVTIQWEPGQHPDVTEYGIFRQTDLGTYVEIKRVDPKDSTYTYAQANADQASRGFRMASYTSDPNLPQTLVDPHFTVFIQAEPHDYCNQSITITWNNYIGWKDSLESYSLYRKINQSSYQLLSTIQANSDTSYTDQNVQYNSIYNYYIIANNSNGIESLSNITEVITQAYIPIDHENFTLNHVIYNGESSQCSFNADYNDQLTSFNLLGKDAENSAFNIIESTPIQTTEQYEVVDNLAPSTEGRYYAVSAIDLCNDSVAATNVIRQVILEGVINDNTATLSWNSGFNTSDEIYDIFISVDGGSLELFDQTTGTNEVEYDLTTINDGQSENFCFKTVAKLPNGYYSESNTICFTLTPVVDMPNAFTPNNDGLNDEIGPSISYASITNYQYIIYDKYGGEIFESSSPDDKWNGKFGSKQVKEGAYIYYIKFTTQWGNNYEKTGGITVIYP